MREPCVFCQIAQDKLHSNVIFENHIVKCFLDMEPINKGHILIIPKSHYLDADELPDETACEIMRVSQRLLKALKKCYKFPGYSIMQNGGEFNDIGHYHMHLFPRYKQDGFSWTFGAIHKDFCSHAVAEIISNAFLTV